MVSSFSSLTGPVCRFGCFVGQLRQAIAAGIGRDHDRLGPLAVLLWNYLARTLRRFAALQARHQAGTLPAAAAPRAASAVERAARPVRPAQALLPRGALLARFGAAHLSALLQDFVEQPETRALLDAAPQAGRLLRPLWRMLTTDALPEPLRLPPRPQREHAALGGDVADPEPASGAPIPTSSPKRRRGVSVTMYVGGRRRRPPPLAGGSALRFSQ